MATGVLAAALGVLGAVHKTGIVFKGQKGAGVIDGISTRVAKEFDDVDDLSDWVKELDDEMAVACYTAVSDLKRWKEEHGEAFLTWERVESIFNNCKDLVKDEKSSKRIHDTKTYDETNAFKFDGSPDSSRMREIITWLKDLFNRNGEQDVIDNSLIFREGSLDHLAAVASETGARIKDFASFFEATEKKRTKAMEIGVIRFPRKGDAKIKLYKLVVYAFFKSKRILFVQEDSSGVEVEYDSVEFKPCTGAIDTRYAAKAKENLKNPDIFDF